MRIAIFDYPGHAFAIQLCRCLAKRGHSVLLCYHAGFPGPKGSLERRPDDSSNLLIRPVDLPEAFQKLNFVKRQRQEIKVGQAFGKQILDFKPDVVAACTVPIDTQTVLMRSAEKVGAASVFWLQDIISIAIRAILKRKMPGMGHIIAAYYRGREARLFRRSDAIVAISEDFYEALGSLDTGSAHRYVVPNWAPLEEIPVMPKDNQWSRANGLADKFVFLYSGTLGLKHNPDWLLHLVEDFCDNPTVRVVLVSEGLGADNLKRAKTKRSLNNLVIVPFQPAALLPQILGTADVLTAFVEPEAGTYSVPSKLLSYFCARRAVLAGIRNANVAARQIAEHGLGIAAEDASSYRTAARELFSNDDFRDACGSRARQYAEMTFDIEKIATEFETIFRTAIAHRRNTF